MIRDTFLATFCTGGDSVEQPSELGDSRPHFARHDCSRQRSFPPEKIGLSG